MAKITVGQVTYDFDLLDITADEATAVEKSTGLNGFDWWKSLASEPSVQAIHGLLYMLQRREDPTVKFADVQFTVADWMTRIEVEDEVTEDVKPARGKGKAPASSTT